MDEHHPHPEQGASNREALREGRHLERAYAQVSQGWLPVNNAVLEAVKQNLNAGNYTNNRKALLADLKKDYSLYFHTIRKLVGLKSEKNAGAPTKETVDPIALISKADLNELKSILNVPDDKISDHSLAAVEPFQAKRIQQSMISASVAEALSGKRDVDEDVAYTCGLLRQMGQTLVSFNYPAVYRRVVSGLGPNSNLEEELTRNLGFSPSLLGVTIAKHWNLNPEIVKAVIAGKAAEDQALYKICSVGEAYARASDPEGSPTAAKDWLFAKDEIQRTLGRKGLDILKERIEKNCNAYFKLAPTLFKIVNPEVAARRIKSSTISIDDNTYVKFCSPATQELLKELYNRIIAQGICRENVEHLIKTILPEAGFGRGCIYLVEPETLKLKPSVPIGRVSLGTLKSIHLDAIDSDPGPIAAAYRASSPIMEEMVFADEFAACIVAGLGDYQRAGVLFLEIAPQLLIDDSANPLLIFKAMRKAFHDCLGIK